MKKIILFVSFVCLSVSLFAQEDPKGLNLDEVAPPFEAKDQNGQMVRLKDHLQKGSVVLVFYRGQWCPYCNKYLMRLQDSISMITAKGASLIAVSPEVMENINKTIKKTRASYPVVHDKNLAIMKAYRVAFAVDQKTIDRYKNYGIDFSEANGAENGANLPVPAVYVINKEGKIVYKHFDKDYTKRASVAEIVQHL